MNRPPEHQPPPYGVLIEAAREDAGLSRREAARRAGISDSWWRYVAAGWQNGPLRGTAETVAAMAHAVGGVTPESLEGKGERPDAARVLRRLLLADGPPPAPARWDDEPQGDAAWALFPRDRTKRWLWRTPNLSEDERAELIALIDRKRAESAPPERQADAGLGIPPDQGNP
jgi:transcriptional regulator with XRE-family HTH domain